MLRPRNPNPDQRREATIGEPVLPDWRTLGARIRRVALVATSLHLVQGAGGALDDGAALETPRFITGG